MFKFNMFNIQGKVLNHVCISLNFIAGQLGVCGISPYPPFPQKTTTKQKKQQTNKYSVANIIDMALLPFVEILFKKKKMPRNVLDYYLKYSYSVCLNFLSTVKHSIQLQRAD